MLPRIRPALCLHWLRRRKDLHGCQDVFSAAALAAAVVAASAVALAAAALAATTAAVAAALAAAVFAALRLQADERHSLMGRC